MKRKFKFFYIFLISILLLNTPESFVKADSKTKQITMLVGEAKKIKIWKKNNNIKFSKKGIIHINKKGKVIAKKVGTVKVIIKHKKKVRKYKIIVKPKELKIDFSKVVKMTVRDLVYGYYVELSLEEMETVKNIFLETSLKQPSINVDNFEKKVGNGSERYKVCMYDIEGEELYNLNVGEDGVQVYNDAAYLATEKINMDVFADFLK